VQAIAGDALGFLLDDERFVDQRRDEMQGLGGRLAFRDAHRLDVVESESAGKHAQPPQQDTVLRRQQVVAPVDGRPQRLMARQSGPAAGGQEPEAIGQTIEDLLRGEDSHSDRGQLDRQRQTVELAADVDDGGLVGRCKLESPRGGVRPLHEEHDRFVLPELMERLIGTGCREVERWHGDHALALHTQWLPAGRDQAHAGRGPDEVADEPGGCSQQVLAVVDEEQQLLVPEVVEKERRRRGGGLVAEVERRQHGVDDELGVAHLAQLDQPGAVFEAASKIGRDPEPEPALAHPARTDEADQAGAGELLSDLSQLTAAADEAGRLGWQVTGALGPSGHLIRRRLPPSATPRRYACDQQFGGLRRCGWRLA
jgi:hypothetical protein